MNTRIIKKFKRKKENRYLHMLTCYDFQTAQMLGETDVDLILVGDSLGNVVLGYEYTVQVGLEEMIIFSSAVRRGAPRKFIVTDLPFGTYSYLTQGIEKATTLFQKTGTNAIKLEGAYPFQLELIERLTQIGIPVMGHIGLTPQSYHQQGGYFIHGKSSKEVQTIMTWAKNLEKAGVFALVLECVTADLATQITEQLTIPTIGIGSGSQVDGQVLVINDLLQLGPKPPPQFVRPIDNLYELKKGLVQSYLHGNLGANEDELDNH